MKTFKLKHHISYSECDERGLIRMTNLVDLLMETSNIQLSQGKAGVKDFLERNLGWVVVNYHFEIDRLPQAGEEVYLTTTFSGYNRFFAYRDFSVETLKHQRILTVKSQWVIIDLDKRKIVAPDADIMASFDNEYLTRMPKFKRLKLKDIYDIKHEYRIRYYDLDTNHHLTNSKYFDFMIDTIPRDFINTHDLVSIDINFKKEVKYGELATAKSFIDKDKLISYQAILNKDNISALAEYQWKKHN